MVPHRCKLYNRIRNFFSTSWGAFPTSWGTLPSCEDTLTSLEDSLLLDEDTFTSHEDLLTSYRFLFTSFEDSLLLDEDSVLHMKIYLLHLKIVFFLMKILLLHLKIVFFLIKITFFSFKNKKIPLDEKGDYVFYLLFVKSQRIFHIRMRGNTGFQRAYEEFCLHLYGDMVLVIGHPHDYALFFLENPPAHHRWNDFQTLYLAEFGLFGLYAHYF